MMPFTCLWIVWGVYTVTIILTIVLTIFTLVTHRLPRETFIAIVHLNAGTYFLFLWTYVFLTILAFGGGFAS